MTYQKVCIEETGSVVKSLKNHITSIHAFVDSYPPAKRNIDMSFEGTDFIIPFNN